MRKLILGNGNESSDGDAYASVAAAVKQSVTGNGTPIKPHRTCEGVEFKNDQKRH